jgi:membrane protein
VVFLCTLTANCAVVCFDTVQSLRRTTVIHLLSMRRWIRLFWLSGQLWLRLDCVDLSAAFAYHALQSVLPALLIALSVASRILGHDDGLIESLLDAGERWLPASAIDAFQAVVKRFLQQGLGAGLFGVAVLLLTASNAYLTLQRGADRIWWRRPFSERRLPWRQLVVRYLRLRIKGMAWVALMGLFIALDQLVSSWRLLGSLDLRAALLQAFPQSLVWQRPVSLGLDLTVSLALTFVGSLLFLWWLPSRRLPWRPLIPGAALCALALTLLNLLLGRVLLALGLRFQAYGVVGGILVLTLWVWLVGVILYYAQCFSFVCAARGLGRRPVLQPVSDRL